MRISPLICALLLACNPVVTGSKGETGDVLDESIPADDSAADDSGGCVPTEEVCNGLDDDCDGEIDEDLLVEVWTDADADGYGDPAAPGWVCEGGDDEVANDDDCLDSDDAVYPGSTARETPGDGIDTDCDGLDRCTDLTCDGVPDLVIAGFYDGDYEAATWVYPQSVGVSDADRTGLPGLGVEDVAAADLDGDGYKDLVLANYYDGTTRSIDSYIYWGSAAGYSEDERSTLPTTGALDVLIDDLDEDGYLDLVFANYRSDSAWSVDSFIYWGGAHGYSEDDRADLPTHGARVVAEGDLDADGDTDLVFCGLQSEGAAYATTSTVYWNEGGSFDAGSRTELSTTGCRDVEIADLNDDGLPDLVFADFYDGASYNVDSVIYWNTGDGYSEAYADLLPTRGAIDVETGDFDGDGHVDVVFAGYSGDSADQPGQTRVFWNSSAGFSASVYDGLDTPGAEALEVSDLDGDGYLDLVVGRGYLDGSYDLDSDVYWGSASGWSDADRLLLATRGSQDVAIGDVDGDGLDELTFASTTGTSGLQAVNSVYWGQDAADPPTWDSHALTQLETPCSRSAPLWVGGRSGP